MKILSVLMRKSIEKLIRFDVEKWWKIINFDVEKWWKIISFDEEK